MLFLITFSNIAPSRQHGIVVLQYWQSQGGGIDNPIKLSLDELLQYLELNNIQLPLTASYKISAVYTFPGTMQLGTQGNVNLNSELLNNRPFENENLRG